MVPSAARLVNDLQGRITAAKLCLQQAQGRQKAFADMHRREVAYNESDMVLLNTKNIKLKKAAEAKKKLMPKWVGP